MPGTDIPNTMVFHRAVGDAVCALEWAACAAIPGDEGVEWFFCVRGEDVANGNRVSAEVSIVTDSQRPEEIVGKRFAVPRSYDDDSGEYRALVYYFDHNDFDEIVLEVLGESDGALRVRWSGVTDDIDFYDGSQPRNRVVIDATFQLRETRDAAYNHPVVEPTPRPSVAASAPDPNQLKLDLFAE